MLHTLLACCRVLVLVTVTFTCSPSFSQIFIAGKPNSASWGLLDSSERQLANPFYHIELLLLLLIEPSRDVCMLMKTLTENVTVGSELHNYFCRIHLCITSRDDISRAKWMRKMLCYCHWIIMDQIRGLADNSINCGTSWIVVGPLCSYLLLGSHEQRRSLRDVSFSHFPPYGAP